jgi:hypothetical protein
MDQVLLTVATVAENGNLLFCPILPEIGERGHHPVPRMQGHCPIRSSSRGSEGAGFRIFTST